MLKTFSKITPKRTLNLLDFLLYMPMERVLFRGCVYTFKSLFLMFNLNLIENETYISLRSRDKI